MNDDVRRETIALLARIAGDGALPADLQRRSIELLASMAAESASPPTVSAAFAMTEAAPSAATAGRRLIYVHGICRHDPGYSNGWWNSLRPFVSGAFGAGQLGDTRLEVLWSDLVNQAAASIAAAAAGVGSEALGTAGNLSVAQAAIVEERRQTAAEEIKETLRDRTARETLAVEAAAQPAIASAAPLESLEAFSLPSIPGMDCVDDFAAYLVDDVVRQAVIDCFTEIVRPELSRGSELDIVSHSWGTVVAYEGLRQLADEGLTSMQVRNFFTVGSALSIGPVRRRLRPANRNGRRPANVRRWVNLDARGDVVGGPLQPAFGADYDFVNLTPVGCGLFGALKPKCAHSSYFVAGNVVVNRDIFARYIDLP